MHDHTLRLKIDKPLVSLQLLFTTANEQPYIQAKLEKDMTFLTQENNDVIERVYDKGT